MRVLAWVGFAATFGLATLRCGAGPTAAQQADVAAWTADDGVCIANAKTRAQADACRDQMRHLFCGDGGLLAGSGGCAHVLLSDGGQP